MGKGGRRSKRMAPETEQVPISGDVVKSRPVKKTRKGKPEPEPEPDPICDPSEVDMSVFEQDEFIDSGDLNQGEEHEPCASFFPTGIRRTREPEDDSEAILLGDPISAAEAIQKWPHHYNKYNKGKNGSVQTDANGSNYEEQAKRHYSQAKVDGIIYNLGDHAYVYAGEGVPNYIARILELFESTEGIPHFTAQWFYRINDTIIQKALEVIKDSKLKDGELKDGKLKDGGLKDGKLKDGGLKDGELKDAELKDAELKDGELKDHELKESKLKESKRVFISQMINDNPLDCLVSKLKIALVKPNMDLAKKLEQIPDDCDLYYDMKYNLPFLTFETIKSDDLGSGSDSTISNKINSNGKVDTGSSGKTRMHLLDLYSGCGAMSTGLCMGASISGVDLVTRWAVDLNSDACNSLKLNHPETEVRNEAAEDFLSLLKEWEILCRDFNAEADEELVKEDTDEDDDDDDDEGSELSPEEFEVEKLLAICYGDPNKTGSKGLHFQVRWKTYGPEYDTWEPIDGLSECKDKVKEFVTEGYRLNILPLPGNADFICGGPPCQGISGFNRFRNEDAPLDDPKNKQLEVFMDIVEYLKPKYVLMENVVDILRFSSGFLARYALGRLVSMNYQTRMGIMAAGAYGLPQFRQRMLLWGAHPFKVLPQYPLPTHEVIAKGGIPKGFEEIAVAYDESSLHQLEKPLRLEDAISDLPSATNDESRDERDYEIPPKTEFQKFIRLKRNDVVGYMDSSKVGSDKEVLYDHRPLQLNADDNERVGYIPKKKGANFRDLPGVLVGPDNKVFFDPKVERARLTSGRYLVPDYAMTFVRGTSPKPFGRLWWDDVIPTVVTRAEPHNQIIIHPVQDRVLTVRENARLQGFPDCYQLLGTIKDRYTQVGNAVAVPVGVALGYCLGLASEGQYDGKPVIKLPFQYPDCLKPSASTKIDDAPIN